MFHFDINICSFSIRISFGAIEKTKRSMEVTKYQHRRIRKEFGQQCNFTEHYEVLVDIPPDDALKKQFVRRNPTDTSSQTAPQMAENECNTESTKYTSAGITHKEGGWPIEIKATDEEQMIRYVKRLQRTEEYETQMRIMCTRMEKKILQNNAINVFKKYYEDIDEIKCDSIDDPEINSIKTYGYPDKSVNVPISANHASFSHRSLDEVVVSYMSSDQKISIASYLWDLNYNMEPLLKLPCESSIATAEFNMKDEFVIGAGQSDGIVAIYDTRIEGPQIESAREASHKDAVKSLLWIYSKTNSEFFTCSTDGCVKWWDTRKMKAPYESYHVGTSDDTSVTNGCCALEFTYSVI